MKEVTALSEQQKNKVSVEIYGQTYNIVGTESPGHMRFVAASVDEQMRMIKRANPSLDSAKLAVLTACNAVNDYLKLKNQVELLESQLKKLTDELNG